MGLRIDEEKEHIKFLTKVVKVMEIATQSKMKYCQGKVYIITEDVSCDDKN